MEGSAQGQMVLHTEQASVAQPQALVEVAFELHPASATLTPQARGGQDAIVANLDEVVDRPLQARPGLHPAGEELGEGFEP
jgi:hypothetical protein